MRAWGRKDGMWVLERGFHRVVSVSCRSSGSKVMGVGRNLARLGF